MARKVIDLCMDQPPSEEYLLDMFKGDCLGDGPIKMAGYRNTFDEKIANLIGTSIAELDKAVAEGGEELLVKTVLEARKNSGLVDADGYYDLLNKLNVSWGFTVKSNHNNEETAAICATHPDKYLGFCYLDPKDGMNAVRELERCVKELKLSALYISAYRTGLPADDKKCYPLYAKCVELGIPVFIYSSMNYTAKLPMYIGHPSHIDEVARDFPDLKIMAAVSGWPWSMDLIGLAMRHDNVCINMEVYDYAEMTKVGSGFEGYLYYAESKIRDKLCFASDWSSQGVPLETLIKNVENLPLRDSTIDNILYNNAARFFERG